MPLFRLQSLACALACAALAFAVPSPLRAAGPYEIDVIEALTGPSSFAGRAQAAALEPLAALVNQAGGIAGRPIRFVVHDDESNPQIALVLMNQILAKHPPFVLGPSDAGSCNAVFPLVARNGPLVYCMSGAVNPPPGDYDYSADVASMDITVAGMRYLRLRGWRRIALITTTDATGQLYDQAIAAALARPENRGVTLVDHEHFSPTDLNVGAQVARIKASGAQVLIDGTAGTPTGTLFRALTDLALRIPVATGNGNASYVEMQQYRSFLPPELYFFGFLCLSPDEVSDRGVRDALHAYFTALRGAGIHPDGLQSSSWDPAQIMLAALRAVGLDASAAQVRAYVENLHGFVGANGRYDFRKTPRRGLDDANVVIARWDAARDGWTAMSRPGGVPLAGAQP